MAASAKELSAGEREALRNRTNGGGRARWLIAREVRSGRIVPAKWLVCVDCGKQAQCYDHRDYNKPFEVEPVCKRCDCIRGAGKWLTGTPDRNWEERRLRFLDKANP